VEEALDRALPAESAWPETVHRAMRYSLFAGGKRIRPLLALAAGESVGGRRADVVPLACAVEMIHTYSLVHDDLPSMDDDDLRRGKPTSHKVFGEAMAILAGDALLTRAFALMAGAPPDAEAGLVRRRLAATAILAEAAGSTGMIGGQVVDLEADRVRHLFHRGVGRLDVRVRDIDGEILEHAVSRHVQRNRRADCRVGCRTAEVRKDVQRLGFRAAVLHLPAQHDVRAAAASSAERTAAEAAPAAPETTETAAATAAAVAPRNDRGRQVLCNPGAEVVAGRVRRGRDVIVLRGARKIRGRDERQELGRGRIDAAGWNPIAGEWTP
jgi:hypothetical protein